MALKTIQVVPAGQPGPATPVSFNFKVGDRVQGSMYVNVEPPHGFDFVIDTLPKVVNTGYNYLGQQYDYVLTVTATGISATCSLQTNSNPVRFLNVRVDREVATASRCLYIRPLLAGIKKDLAIYNGNASNTEKASWNDRTRWGAFVTHGAFVSAYLPSSMITPIDRRDVTNAPSFKMVKNLAELMLTGRERKILFTNDALPTDRHSVNSPYIESCGTGVDALATSLGAEVVKVDGHVLQTGAFGYDGTSGYFKQFGLIIVQMYFGRNSPTNSSDWQANPMSDDTIALMREAMLAGTPFLLMSYRTGPTPGKFFAQFSDKMTLPSVLYTRDESCMNQAFGHDQSFIWYGDHPAWEGLSEAQRFDLGGGKIVSSNWPHTIMPVFAADVVGETIPEYPGTWYNVGCYDVDADVELPEVGGNMRADCCFYEGELYETEVVVTASFANPPNWESLLQRGKIDITWTGPFPSDQLQLIEMTDDKLQARFKFSHVMSADDAGTTVVLPITITAQDTRFRRLTIKDVQVVPVQFELPCFTVGNEPAFTITDAQVTETDTGTQIMTFTVSASERVVGNSITIDYQTVDVTATSLSSSVQMQYALYDAQDRPFLGYLEYQKIRAVFDGSVPRYFNSRLNAVGYENVGPLLTNIVRWLDREERGNRILIIGDQENTASNYSVKGTDATGFGVNFVQHLTALGYNVDVLYVSEVAGGFPNDTYFDAYAVVIYLCTIAPLTISPVLTGAIERATKAGMGLYVLADHEPYYTANANAIAAKFVAKFQGDYNRTSGTNIDANRAARGDNPFIAGLTGTMPGDVSESVVVTDGSIVVQADYESTSGTLTFAQGERSKTLQVTIINDDLEEGDELFHMELSQPSRGSLDREYGVGTILDDDVVPFGTAQGSGGSGVVFRSLGYANKTGVFIVAWNAFGAHDRFDLFRQGAFLSSSNEDIDRNYAINNSLPRVVPAYDKLAWEAAGGTPSAAIFDVHQRLPNRAGSSIMCIPHYVELGYAPVYDIRCEGPNGTGWEFITAEDGVRPCVGPGQVALAVDNGRFKRERILLHDMSQNLTANAVTFRLTLNNLGQNNTAGSPVYTKPSGSSGTPFDVNNCSAVDVPVRIVLRRVGQVVAQSAWIAPGASGSIQWNYNKLQDFKYMEVFIEADPNGIANYVAEWRPDASYNMAVGDRSKPVRSNWNYTIEVV